jgi:hypothetical protein
LGDAIVIFISPINAERWGDGFEFKDCQWARQNFLEREMISGLIGDENSQCGKNGSYERVCGSSRNGDVRAAEYWLVWCHSGAMPMVINR